MAHSTPTEASPPLPNRHGSKLALPAALVCVVWVLGLAAMVLQTANPLTLNRRQIEVSTMVVQAEVTRLVPGEVRVEKFLLGSGKDSQLILVRNLNQTPAQIGQRYLLPLVPVRDVTGTVANGLYDVTPTGLPENQPLIYPNSDEAMQLFETLLKPSEGQKNTP